MAENGGPLKSTYNNPVGYPSIRCVRQLPHEALTRANIMAQPKGILLKIVNLLMMAPFLLGVQSHNFYKPWKWTLIKLSQDKVLDTWTGSGSPVLKLSYCDIYDTEPKGLLPGHGLAK